MFRIYDELTETVWSVEIIPHGAGHRNVVAYNETPETVEFYGQAVEGDAESIAYFLFLN